MKRDILLEQIVDAEALFCLVRDKIDKELLLKGKASGNKSTEH